MSSTSSTQRRLRSRLTALTTGLALVLAPAVVASPATAADTTILSTDFEDASWQADWSQSGGPALSVVDVDGTQALQVADRVNDYDGIQTVAARLSGLVAGQTYTFSMKARLAAGTTGEAGVRLVMKPSYTWIGATTMTADAWATVSGTFTVPDPAPADLQLYVGTGPVTGVTGYTYLVDDIVVTGPPTEPEGPTAVVANDFETTTAPWVPRGSTVALTSTEAHGGASSLLVSARQASWAGTQADVTGTLLAGESYDVAAWVKLPAGTVGTSQVKVTAQTEDGVASTQYTQVTTPVDVTADGWVQLTGTWVRPAGLTSVILYVEATDIGAAHPDLLVDDVTVTGAGAGGDDDGDYVETDPDFVPGGAVNAVETPVVAARGTTKTSALTFDDGPNGATTIELLDFLEAQDVTATFCVIGQNVQAPGGADVLRRIVADGHTLCNHSTDYEDLGGLTKTQVAAKLKQNLQIIRTALNDPFAEVPYFRAPNGSWGRTNQVAVALGMQPLAVANVIFDWDGAENAGDVDALTTALRDAITTHPGELVLVHDGGGDRTAGVQAVKTVVAELLADGWTFTLPQGGAVPKGQTIIDSDFEDGTLQGWVPRDDGNGPATLAVTSDDAHESTFSARVSDRVSQGQGLQYDVAGLMVPGASYDVEAWLKFEGTPGDMTLSAHTRTGGTDAYANLVQLPGMSSSQWVRVTGTFTMPAYDDAAELYFETRWANGEAGNTSTFLVDDILVRSTPPAVIQDLPPLQDTVEFPVGVAIDSRETGGSASQLLLRHFDQVTSENYMKPEAWYDAAGTFRRNPEATTLMDFAQEHDLRVYGHTLMWHSQTPAWFFQDGGRDLTDSPADQEILRQRLHDHVFAVAADLAGAYGPFGSDTNPLVAFDVVNEVVDDGTTYADGMRRSRWYQVLGEQFVDLAFQYADEAFNDLYAADGADRPVTLFINDYNTEQAGKRGRLHALVERLLDRGVPVDGVGHQFHLALSTPVSTLADALAGFEDLPVVQAVTELDVVVGSAEQARLIDQGYYYRDAFRIFREHADDLFSVTLWGLTDGRSWRAANNGRPLLFDDFFQAKPAYFGAADGELPAAIRSANVFAADPGADYSAGSLEWQKLPLHPVGEDAGFQLRWAPDTLTAFVDVDDTTPSGDDAVVLETADGTVTLGRDSDGDADGTATERTGGWSAVVRLPLAGAAQGDTSTLDVRVVDDGTTAGWNTPGVLGSLALVEPLSYLEVTEASAAPAVDGDVDAAWADAGVVRTAKETTGTGGAQADVRTLWQDQTLYVLADVVDPVVDTTGSDPWTKDSVEIYVDAGNAKNGSYRYDDTQIRINANNEVSFGSGDETFQRNRLTSAVVRTDAGYRVEAAISLLEYGGLGTFHGLDFQVNDAAGGVRTAITNWADPTNAGYLSTAHWGVGRLVGPAGPVTVAPVITQQPVSTTGRLGSWVTLSAAATGTPEPTAAWERRAPGGSAWIAVPGDTGDLRVRLLPANDGASYRVTFTNSAGAVTSEAATVHVEGVAPHVVLRPRSATGALGSTVTLRAAAAGYPAPTATWELRRPGSSAWTPVPGRSSSATTLTVAWVSIRLDAATDGAQVRAVFANAAGSVTTSPVTVDVRRTPPRITHEPGDTGVRVGRTATFSVDVTGYPAPAVQWYERRAGSLAWTRIPGATASTLEVVGTWARDGAHYRAVATSPAGSDTSRSARLDVR